MDSGLFWESTCSNLATKLKMRAFCDAASVLSFCSYIPIVCCSCMTASFSFAFSPATTRACTFYEMHLDNEHEYVLYVTNLMAVCSYSISSFLHSHTLLIFPHPLLVLFPHPIYFIPTPYSTMYVLTLDNEHEYVLYVTKLKAICSYSTYIYIFLIPTLYCFIPTPCLFYSHTLLYYVCSHVVVYNKVSSCLALKRPTYIKRDLHI